MAIGVRDFARPFLWVFPEFQRPDRNVPFNEKNMFTAIWLVLFFICSHLPLIGIHRSTGSDPFYWPRFLVGSTRGTVMELGITPIVASGLLMRLFVRSKIIDVDDSDRAHVEYARKLLGILVAIAEAVAYVLLKGQLGTGTAIFVILQLCFGSYIALRLDDLQREQGP